MRWPWQKKRKRTERQLRHRDSLWRLETAVQRLWELYDIRPDSWAKLITERDELKEKFREAVKHQGELCDRIYRMERAACPLCGAAVYPQPPAPPSKSDPDFDAAMRSAAVEDQSKRKG